MSRTVLLSLEGVPLEWLRARTREGFLPVLKEMLRTGASAVLDSRPSLAALPRWASLLTGRSPAAHGIFGNLRVTPGIPPQATVPSAEDLPCEAVFSVAARQGRSVAALNFPLTAGEPLPGLTLVPGGQNKRSLPRTSVPSDVISRLKGVPGLEVDALAVNAAEEASALSAWEAGDSEPWRNLHRDRDLHWIRAGEWLLSQTAPDLFALNLEGLGKFLRLDGTLLADFDSSPENEPLRSYLGDVNAALEGLLAALSGEDRLFLGSPYDLQPVSQVVSVNVWLESLGFLHWSESSTPRSSRQEGLNLPPRRASLPLLDYERTLAYGVDGSGSLYLRPDAPLDTKIRLMEAAGKPDALFAAEAPYRAEVRLFEEVFGQPLPPGAPALVLQPPSSIVFSSGRSEATVYPLAAPLGSGIGNGWLLACGGAIDPLPRELPPAGVLDFAPTLLYSLGLPTPEDWEGAPRTDLFSANYRDEHPAQIGPKTFSQGIVAASAGESPADADEQIFQRLQALGYVE